MMSNPFKRLLFHHENGISLVKTKPLKIGDERTSKSEHLPWKSGHTQKDQPHVLFQVIGTQIYHFYFGKCYDEVSWFSDEPIRHHLLHIQSASIVLLWSRRLQLCTTSFVRAFFDIQKQCPPTSFVFFFEVLSNLMVFWNNKSNPRLKDSILYTHTHTFRNIRDIRSGALQVLVPKIIA